MADSSLLYKRSYPINQFINIYIPTVGEIIDDEDNYYSLVYALTAMPIDMMVQLDEKDVDFTTIDDYDLFLRIFDSIRRSDTSLIFPGLDLSAFEPAINPENKQIVFADKARGIVIDREIHRLIAEGLRLIHHLHKNNKKPANPEAKDYLLKQARKKIKRAKNRKKVSQLETLIVAMVNTEQFKYNFEGTRELSIYQFNESVRQIMKKVDYDNRMHGVYTGTVNVKELSQDDLNWLVHK